MARKGTGVSESRPTSRAIRSAAETLIGEMLEAREGQPGRQDDALPVRAEFVGNPSGQIANKPPMARMMRGSRGWSSGARVKTYMTLLWLATRVDVNARRPLYLPPRTMEHLELLTGLSRRRLNQAIRDLEGDGFLEIDLKDRKSREDSRTATSRRASEVCVRHERGQVPYEFPQDDENWFAVGGELWAGGWLHRMPGQALAALLILLANSERSAMTKPIWVATTQLPRYGMGHHSWVTGTAWLVDNGLFKRHRHAPSPYRKHARADYTPKLPSHSWLSPYANATSRAESRAALPTQAVSYVPSQTSVIGFRQAMRKYLREYKLATTSVEKHTVANKAVLYAVRHRNDDEHAKTALRSWSRTQIKHAESYLEATIDRPLPAHHGYRRLIDLLEEEGNYTEALGLARRARDQGWGRDRKGADSWDNKIKKLEDGTTAQAVTEWVASLSDEDLYEGPAQ